jgi:hypothetical protein
MRTSIGAKLLSSKVSQPTKKPFEIYDSRLAGFALRVQPTGVRSYYARFGRSRRIALGKVGTLLPDEARERCQKVLGNVAHGRHHGLSGADGLTLGQFIDESYAPWAKATDRSPTQDTFSGRAGGVAAQRGTARARCRDARGSRVSQRVAPRAQEDVASFPSALWRPPDPRGTSLREHRTATR